MQNTEKILMRENVLMRNPILIILVVIQQNPIVIQTAQMILKRRK